MLATDAGEQNSCSTNPAHVLVQTKESCGSPSLSQLALLRDAFAPGRAVFLLDAALLVPSILSVPTNQEPGCLGQVPQRAIASFTGC